MIDLDAFGSVVAEHVRTARVAAGLAQTGLARAADVSDAAIFALERGEAASVAVRDLAAVLGALRLDVRDLFPPQEYYARRADEQEQS